MKTQETKLPRLITAEDLAAQLGEQKFTIYTLAREKGLPHIRLGRAIRFDPRAVAVWLASGGTS